jgi:hypothetical protein
LVCEPSDPFAPPPPRLLGKTRRIGVMWNPPARCNCCVWQAGGKGGVAQGFHTHRSHKAAAVHLDLIVNRGSKLLPWRFPRLSGTTCSALTAACPESCVLFTEGMRALVRQGKPSNTKCVEIHTTLRMLTLSDCYSSNWYARVIGMRALNLCTVVQAAS